MKLRHSVSVRGDREKVSWGKRSKVLVLLERRREEMLVNFKNIKVVNKIERMDYFLEDLRVKKGRIKEIWSTSPSDKQEGENREANHVKLK